MWPHDILDRLYALAYAYLRVPRASECTSAQLHARQTRQRGPMIVRRTQVFDRLYALILPLANEGLTTYCNQPADIASYGVDFSPCNGSIAPCRDLRQNDCSYCESRTAIKST